MIAELLSVLHVDTLLLILISTTVAIFLGALPGIGPDLAMVLILPFTFFMEPQDAFILLGSLFGGAIYGGAIPAILLNTPGTAGNVASVLEGYPMARQGRGAEAIGISITSSVFGGIVSVLVMLFAAPLIADVALAFGPAEYFWLSFWGLTLVASLTESSVRRGLISLVIGLFLGFVGVNPQTGVLRYTFGNPNLYDGLGLVPFLIGMFALAEVLVMSASEGSIAQTATMRGSLWAGLLMPFKYMRTLLRSTGIGTIFGAIPGLGLVAAAYFAYAEARRSSRDRKTFGQGNPEGLVAAESANNAVPAGSLIPTLSLGIPGSSGTAIFLGAIALQGLRPGPEIFTVHSHIFHALAGGMLLANIFIFVVGAALANVFAKVTLVPMKVLAPVVSVFALAGSYAYGNSLFGVSIAVAVGFLAYIMRRNGYSIIPLILGFILGPIVEVNFTRAMMIGRRDPIAALLPSSLSIGLMLVAVLSLAWTVYREWKERRGDAVTASYAHKT